MSDILTVENIVFYLFSLVFWPSSYFIFKRYNQNKSLAKNFNHLLHAVLFVKLYKFLDHNVLNYPIIFSLGFYTFDIFYILHSLTIKRESFSRHFPYIIHHIIANYGLWLALVDYCRGEIMYFYYILEYSNFLLYASYHIQKAYPNHKNLIIVSESFQFVWYTYFRIVRFLIYSYQIREVFYSVDFSVKCAALVLFFMGVYWSFNLFQKCLRFLKIETIPYNESKID